MSLLNVRILRFAPLVAIALLVVIFKWPTWESQSGIVSHVWEGSKQPMHLTHPELDRTPEHGQTTDIEAQVEHGQTTDTEAQVEHGQTTDSEAQVEHKVEDHKHNHGVEHNEDLSLIHI